MKRQFLHEDHNRQDKAKKPDYQEEMRLKKPTYAPTLDVRRLNAKIAARQHEIQRVRTCRFFSGGSQFKFGWSLEHFAKMNALAVGESATKEAFEKVRATAELDMNDIQGAIMKGTVRPISLHVKGLGRTSLGVFGVDWSIERIRCDEIRR